MIVPSQTESGGKGSAADQSSAPAAPSISLPKGGGAIRGMGEKFAANPVTGTGSMTVPIATSPGRSGFGPQLALSYDSGAGNGPYGFGWSLSLPSITRKTDKGLPKYQDADESDVFILSGAEDLVPVFKIDSTTGEFVKDAKGNFVYDEFPRDGYLVRRYRPRIEGLFARIERWTNVATGEIHWRSISRDNITTLYGKDNWSRVFDPAELDNNYPADLEKAHPGRIFTWLISQSYDDKGNAIIYEYAAENDDNIDHAQANERNRVRTANRYVKRVKYGNRAPNRDLATWQASDPARLPNDTWLFEVVFDYDDGHYREQPPDADGRIFALATIDLPPTSSWPVRQDPFSSYRAGFEVRTYRLCRRVLMFHHFPDELGTADYLVRSTEFTYDPSPIASFITEVTQSGYVRQLNGNYLKKSLPPLTFEYSQATLNQEVHDVDPESLQNLPVGADGARYQWLDLDGEGLQCVLAEQDDAWYYKRNVSPLSFAFVDGKSTSAAHFDPVTEVATLPSFAEASAQHHQFLDLAGDGQLDCVVLERPVAGFFERTHEQDWEPFKPIPSLPNLDWSEPNLRFVDLTGDGHADILITEDEALVWHLGLEKEGFGEAIQIPKPRDEEKGPVVAFADATQAIFLADLSGDGLTDIVRIRNGEICYWPNLGYGRFGPKVAMDNSPWFDAQDQFDQRRLRLADIDGSGTTDIIYLHRDGVDIYRNQCGNAWSGVERLSHFPSVDNVSSIQAVDVLGNGTACLVWTSPLPGDTGRPMRYIDLMSGQKPHLLLKTANNLGAETVLQYAPSTKFYLQDKLDDKPWITRLPFPVHCVERVETRDLISRNRFVTRYAYHHGYYDGIEREFRGFGMVEQWDTEELGALKAGGTLPDASNIDESSYVPPAYTKTWFHTGAYIEEARISRHFQDEYYHEGDESEGVPGLSDEQLEAMLLPDTELPTTLKRQDGSSIPWELTADEIREACRALRGAVLRREIYAHDGSDDEDRPYSATEQNYTIELLQPRGKDRYAVFFTHARESADFHYERKLVEVAGKKIADPRVTHAVTLEVDGYGNVLKSMAIGYGRRPGLSPLQGDDKDKQEQTHVTYAENEVTNPIHEADDYRTPLPSAARTFELINMTPDDNLPDITNLFGFNEMAAKAAQASDGSHDLPYEDVLASQATKNHPYRRLIKRVRTLYRKDDLSGLLLPGILQSLALPGESYKLAFTPGLLAQVFRRNGEALLSNPADVLGGQGSDRGGYVDLDGDGHWWTPSGRVFYSPTTNDMPSSELAFAHQHFLLPHRYRDPFHTNAVSTESIVNYDAYDLLIIQIRDAIGNTVSATNDYRGLTQRAITDPNGNRSEVAFDALGMVAGTAVMGKATETLGDLLDALFEQNPTQAQLDAFMAEPREASVDSEESVASQIVYDLLAKATTRVIYDLDRFKRLGEPPFAATIARETHVSDLQPGQQTKVQISFSYSDGFGREIQKKIQAEPGRVPRRDASGEIIVDTNDQPVMTTNDASPRWVGNGWTVFNNKGKPVRQYEPFFTDTHRFEFDVKIGVRPVFFYDAVERVVATLHPNHTWEKVVFDPWRQESWDVNDTVLATDPKDDADVGDFFRRIPDTDYLPTWYAARVGGALGPEEQDAAGKTAVHAATPTVAYADSLGRIFVTVAHNKFKYSNTPPADPPFEEFYVTRLILDVEGNQREVIDAKDRVVMRYDYDMLGNRIHQASMEAGGRWSLSDAAGKPLYLWDSRDHQFRNVYDPLRRPTDSFLTEGTSAEVVIGRTSYGESRPDPEATNLRGKLVELRDQAGVVTSDEYDFKGNLLRGQRRLAEEYSTTLDWSGEVTLTDTYASRTSYDALNRPVSLTMPDNSVICHSYNEANLLERVEANLRGAATATPFVTNTEYDARGRRTLIDYGNRVRTTYEYDPLTFRLTCLVTRRDSVVFPDDCPQPPPAGWPGCQVQDLRYTYDPAGNITHIRDDAQQTIYFRNRRVEPSAEYTYDAVYRLIEATGREHLGQVGGSPIPHSYNDAPRTGLLHPGDGNAMGMYLERYTYDAAGNFLVMQHRGSDPANPGWTRSYAYNETSLIEPGKQSNRLSSTTIGNGGSVTERYAYDAHGSMLRMPQLQAMQWDFKDQLQMSQRQAVNDADADGVQHGGERTYYVYDSTGERVRKVTELSTGQVRTERIYLGAFEVYRKTGANPFLRETLHVMDDKQRIALVETRAEGRNSGPQQLTRYQFSNHLGSVRLELDEHAQIISYEEYNPYGNTTYQAAQNQTETRKRCRYMGKERDEETGFNYHTARYYAPWLGVWTRCDPSALADQLDAYRFCRSNPVKLVDPNGNQSAPTGFDPLAEMTREFASLFEIPFGGRTSVHGAGNEATISWEPPRGGVGGVAGPILRTATARLVPLERNPSASSAAGMQVGATTAASIYLIPEVGHLLATIDAIQTLSTGHTTHGAAASRTDYALSMLQVIIAGASAAATIRARLSGIGAPGPVASQPEGIGPIGRTRVPPSGRPHQSQAQVGDVPAQWHTTQGYEQFGGEYFPADAPFHFNDARGISFEQNCVPVSFAALTGRLASQIMAILGPRQWFPPAIGEGMVRLGLSRTGRSIRAPDASAALRIMVSYPVDAQFLLSYRDVHLGRQLEHAVTAQNMRSGLRVIDWQTAPIQHSATLPSSATDIHIFPVQR